MTREQLASLVESAADALDSNCSSCSESTIRKLHADVQILMKLADCIRWNTPMEWLEDDD